jgi:hypothetical protein
MTSWHSFLHTIQQWQTLVAATIALAAAIIAWNNATRTIRSAANLEKHRRAQKLASLRATLPLALSTTCDYAESAAQWLFALHSQCEGGSLPRRENVVWPGDKPLPPTDTLKAISEFIEYSDEARTSLFEDMLSEIQILNARIRGLFEGSRGRRSRTAGSQNQVEEYILNCAHVYAAASAIFGYARRETSALPEKIGWTEIKSALNNMGLWEHELPQVHQTIRRRSDQGISP